MTGIAGVVLWAREMCRRARCVDRVKAFGASSKADRCGSRVAAAAEHEVEEEEVPARERAPEGPSASDERYASESEFLRGRFGSWGMETYGLGSTCDCCWGPVGTDPPSASGYEYLRCRWVGSREVLLLGDLLSEFFCFGLGFGVLW